MAVVFTSTVKLDESNDWYIEIKDMLTEDTEICKDIEEYSKKLEEMGSEYGGHIDSVNWYKDDNVPPYHLDELRTQMAKYKEENDIKLEEE